MFAAAALGMEALSHWKRSEPPRDIDSDGVERAVVTGKNEVILYWSAWNDPAPWKKALAELLPDMEFRVFPHEVGNKEDITFALVFDPPLGFLKSLPNLKATLSIATGTDHLTKDLDYPKHVPIHRMVDNYQMLQMAQYAVHAVLRQHRMYDEYAQQQSRMEYRRLPRTLTTPETGVLVLGLGNMGKKIATAISQLGFATYGWSRTQTAVDNVQCFAGKDSLDTVLPLSDFVICVLPFNSQTAGILSASLFKKLRHGAVIVNLGRGGHVNNQDLLDGLSTGQLSAAYLDVFDPEPLDEASPFWKHPRVTVTPHVGGELVARECAKCVVANILRYTASSEKRD